MIEKTLDITTKDGAMETFICHPERNGPSPAVFFLMDAYGVREELKDMARSTRGSRASEIYRFRFYPTHPIRCLKAVADHGKLLPRRLRAALPIDPGGVPSRGLKKNIP